MSRVSPDAGPRVGRLALAVLATAVVWSGCPSPQPPVPPAEAILLLVVDALRPDHLGTYGYHRPTSPTLDRLAGEGTVFEAAFSPCGWTRPSIASMFTGLYPSDHGLRERARKKNEDYFLSRLDDSFTTLAEILRDRGYDTVAVVSNPHLGRGQGFEQGFDAYFDTERTADEVLDRLAAWWRERQPAKFFGFLHFMDVHWPYTPPSPYDRRFGTPEGSIDFTALDWNRFRRQLRSGEIVLSEADLRGIQTLYDGQIRYLDDRLGQFLDEIGSVSDSWLILVTADHGEEFQEHGNMGHGPFLYDVNTRVPWILRLPGGRGGGRRVDGPVSTIDILPTLLEAAGAPVPPAIGGRSRLAGDGNGGRPGSDLVFGEEHYENLYWRDSVRSARFKFIRTTVRAGPGGEPERIHRELYDLTIDPLERRNLVGLRPRLAAEMAASLDAHLARLARSPEEGAAEVPLEPETLEELRSLGYME